MGASVELPDTVNLCGIRHRVRQAEGMIVFTEDGGVWGCVSRIAFCRRAGLWYVSVAGTDDSAPACHILKAYEILAGVFGGDHEMKGSEHQP